MKMSRKTLQKEVWFLKAKLQYLGDNFSSTWAGPLPKRLDVLTPDNSFIEREVSLNPLLPL
jgi:hypothetical protein